MSTNRAAYLRPYESTIWFVSPSHDTYISFESSLLLFISCFDLPSLVSLYSPPRDICQSLHSLFMVLLQFCCLCFVTLSQTTHELLCDNLLPSKVEGIARSPSLCTFTMAIPDRDIASINHHFGLPLPSSIENVK